MSALLAIINVAAAAWVGAIVFQSFVVAPTTFKSLDESQARGFLRALFPRFYQLGLACGVIMLIATGIAGSVSGWPPLLRWLLAAAAVMTAAEFVSLRMVPGINAARDQGAAGRARFDRLHRASVLLTLLILILGLAALVLLAVGAAPGLR